MSLTDKERRVLSLLAQGKRDKEIAAIIHRDWTTVRFHVENAMKKLGARTRPQAVALLIKEEI